MDEDSEIKYGLKRAYCLPIKVVVKKVNHKKTSRFTAECLEFGLVAHGDTELQAVALLREQVGLYLDSCQALGTINETMEAASFNDLTTYYSCRTTENYFHVLDKSGEFKPEWNNMDGSSCSYMKRKKMDDGE